MGEPGTQLEHGVGGAVWGMEGGEGGNTGLDVSKICWGGGSQLWAFLTSGGGGAPPTK